MSLKKIAKNKIKKTIFKIIKPFLPFILVIGLLFFFICLIIDTVFVHQVQADSSSMSYEEKRIRDLCIDKANYLNKCHNYIGTTKTNSLLDINDREIDKQIQWSHLYTLMNFNNMTNNKELNEDLLNEIGKEFESTFKYEKYIIKTETTITTTDENGNTKTDTKTEEKTVYLLIESDTIYGNYKYFYNEKTLDNNNVKTTYKEFTHQELIGESYARLKSYLRNELKVNEDDIDTDCMIIIEAANGFYDGEENTNWLSSSNNIITDGKSLVPTRYVCMAYARIYKNYFPFWYENSSNISVNIVFIVELMSQLLLVQTLLLWLMEQL